MFLWWGYGVTKFDCVETIVRLNVLELIITTETSFLITMLDKRLRKEGHPTAYLLFAPIIRYGLERRQWRFGENHEKMN